MRARFFAVLGCILIGFGCSKRPVTGIAVDHALGAIVPPESTVLAGIRADELKSSAFYKRYQKNLDIPLLDAFSERVGLDPRRDLSDILIAWTGKQPIFIARGRFVQAQLEQKLGALGARRMTYEKYTLFGDRGESLVFLKKDIAVAAPEDTLRTIIDIHESGKGGVPEELQGRLANLPKQDQIWIASRQGLPFADMPMRSEISSALSNIVAFVSGAAGGVGFDTGAHIQIEILCVSDEGAQRVRDALRGGIGLARLSTKTDERELLRLYDAIHVEQNQQSIHVQADLSEDLADHLIQRLLTIRF